MTKAKNEKMKRKWLGIGVLLVFSIAIISCQKPDAPEFKELNGLDIKLNGLTSASIAAEALFHNPNNTSITLKELDINVKFKDKPITNINKQLDMKINKHADFTIPVDMAVSFKSLTIQDVLKLLKKDRGPVLLHFQGFARVKMYGIPFKVPVDHYQEFTKSI